MTTVKRHCHVSLSRYRTIDQHVADGHGIAMADIALTVAIADEPLGILAMMMQPRPTRCVIYQLAIETGSSTWHAADTGRGRWLLWPTGGSTTLHLRQFIRRSSVSKTWWNTMRCDTRCCHNCYATVTDAMILLWCP